MGARLAAAMCLLATASPAASLAPVNNWGAAGLPGDVSMYVYVPDQVATNPPVLTLVHYCGGTAQAVFGQAQAGGLVDAADEHGFIMVVPSSGRCWDVVSNKTRARDGGGDSHAIKQMVTYALETYDANPNRVYATGDSSGGMMTELLLGLYPDVFKAGAAFAGMPAGCRGAGESGNGGGYSGACAGGAVTQTPQQWGEVVRGMYPGYVGHHPRVQLFHGDDDPIIKYPNHTEAIKEWIDVLGLSSEPTSTSSTTLGQHQATRQSWKNDCGYVVLDAFTSLGGDHGPSDALFQAQFVVPFLGLDRAGLVDPELEQCNGVAGSGAGGASGASGAGGGEMNAGAGQSGLAGSGGVAGSGAGGASGASSPSAGTGAGLGPMNPGAAGGSTVTHASEPNGCVCALGASGATRHLAPLPLGLALLLALRRARRPAPALRRTSASS